MAYPPVPPLEIPGRPYFQRETVAVAKDLLGMGLLRRIGSTWVGGKIVETEAYLHEADLASHSARGKRVSNAAMFAAAATLYVYPIHAKYCFNVVTEPEGCGAAVLIRALEPLWGIPEMIAHRETESLVRLTSGPAMLCQALSIDRSWNGKDLFACDDLVLTRYEKASAESIATSPRIGLSKSVDLPLRFFIRGNHYVSGPKRWHRLDATSRSSGV